MTKSATNGQLGTSRQLDLDRPNPGRVYDYLLGGRRNYAMDRVFADRVLAVLPRAPEIVCQNQRWLRRLVRYAVANGIRQFLTLGGGMPVEQSVHCIAQAMEPECRVVYVENEPVTAAHCELSLEGNERAILVQTNAQAPADVLGHPSVRAMLEVGEPMMVVAGSFLTYSGQARGVARLQRVLAPGSYVALTSLTGERQGEDIHRAAELFRQASQPVYLHGRREMLALLAGFELVEPGVVFTPEWHPDQPTGVGEAPERAAILVAVGRKA